MVTVKKLIDRMDAVGLPYAFMQFEETEETPVPEPPYMVYLLPHSKGRGADTQNNIKEADFSIELYTDSGMPQADREALEKSVESMVFFDVEYDKYIAKIETENMIQTAWEVSGLLEKGAKK